MPEYRILRLTTEFMRDLTGLSRDDQRRVLRALEQLDANAQAPGLDVHPLHGPLEGQWAARASKGLRVTFRRLDNGNKLIIGCSHHYGD